MIIDLLHAMKEVRSGPIWRICAWAAPRRERGGGRAAAQGVVVESSGMAHCLEEVVRDCHDHGLFIFSWGEANNDLEIYNRQKSAGVDAVIMDDVVKITKAPPPAPHHACAHLSEPGCLPSLTLPACAAASRRRAADPQGEGRGPPAPWTLCSMAGEYGIRN